MRGRKPNEIAPGSSVLMEAPKPPAHLAPDAKREWKRIAPILVERGVLTGADLGILESYCTAFARMREAERTIAREGVTFLNARGEHKRHPASGIQNESIKTMRLCANELGLTPVSRSRSNFKTDDGDDSSLDF
ncbi:phage terminase small subunit P27 family [Aureimonas psammosilenae]|uniref:phage terminase small subunit P27 family n=1 Tax=Aureimonas psammosilenae TaxID=2495496 RepID=UPI0012606597|nr:phage terminase small subunit P27 family [Aureimonas psammosilenae]